jgi:hypothetical protein
MVKGINGFNWFDVLVVAAGWVEIGVGTGGAIASLRVLRVLRLLRLLAQWESAKVVGKSVGLAVAGASLSLLFLFVYLFVFSLVGMQVFGSHYFFPDGYPVSNFDTWWDAWLTCFTVVTLSVWPDAMRNGIRASGYASSIFFIVMFIGGVWIILNIFLAAVLEAFEEGFEEITEVEIHELQGHGDHPHGTMASMQHITITNTRTTSMARATTPMVKSLTTISLGLWAGLPWRWAERTLSP